MPVLKVKKNGVWEYVGGVAGGSNLPDYTEEDYGKVLSPSANGLTWAEQTGGNGIIVQPEQPTDVEDGTLWIDTDEEDEENGVLIVTVDGSTMTASHSASEIVTASETGRVPYLCVNMGMFVFLYPISIKETGCLFGSTMPLASGNTQLMRITVNEDKSVTDNSVNSAVVPIPTESDYDKVLSATADGLVWTEQTGGGSGTQNVPFYKNLKAVDTEIALANAMFADMECIHYTTTDTWLQNIDACNIQFGDTNYVCDKLTDIYRGIEYFGNLALLYAVDEGLTEITQECEQELALHGVVNTEEPFVILLFTHDEDGNEVSGTTVIALTEGVYQITISYDEYDITDVSFAKSIQSNWNQTHPDAVDYIKNKPFGKQQVSHMFFNGTVTTAQDDSSGLIFASLGVATDIFYENIPETIDVVFEGNAYTLKLVIGGICGACVGNESILAYAILGDSATPEDLETMGVKDTGEPFIIPLDMDGVVALVTKEVGTYTLSLTSNTIITNVMPEEYIPSHIITSATTQSDWDQTDPTAVDYIKNKPSKNYIALIDQSTGEECIVYIKDGALVVQPITEVLQDFTYTINDNGTYTLTGWNGTLNGEASTELVVPDIKVII